MSRVYVSPGLCLEGLECYIAEFQIPHCIPQALKAKCRELARSMSGLLVAPVMESMLATRRQSSSHAFLWIVTKVNFLSSSKEIHTKLSNMNIVLKDKAEVSSKIVESCYKFTAMARLAPKWNAISSWLVQGLQFLTDSKASAIDFEVAVTSSDITLHLNVHKICFSFVKPEDLGLTPIVTRKFRTDPDYVITEMEITANQCIVLPNLTKAFIYSASHHLPVSPEFPNYDKLRLHWKKQHGMILPDAQNTFYQVYFSANSRKFFSYPGCCVLASTPLVYPSRCVDEVGAAFLCDLRARLPSLCGSPLHFSNTPLHPPQHLTSASGGDEPTPGSDYQRYHTATPNEDLSVRKKPVVSERQERALKDRTNISATSKITTPVKNNTPKNFSSAGVVAGCSSPPTDQPPAVVPDRPPSKLSLKRSANKNMNNTSHQVQPAKRQCTHSPVQPVLSQTTLLQTRSEDPLGQPSHSQPSQNQDGFTLPQPQLTATPSTKDLHHPANLPVIGAQLSDGMTKKIERSKMSDLKSWLTAHGVKFRSKDKKTDLVASVAGHLARTGQTFP